MLNTNSKICEGVLHIVYDVDDYIVDVLLCDCDPAQLIIAAYLKTLAAPSYGALNLLPFTVGEKEWTFSKV